MRLFEPVSKGLFAPRQSRKTVSANPFSLQSIEAAGLYAAVRQALGIVTSTGRFPQLADEFAHAGERLMLAATRAH